MGSDAATSIDAFSSDAARSDAARAADARAPANAAQLDAAARDATAAVDARAPADAAQLDAATRDASAAADATPDATSTIDANSGDASASAPLTVQLYDPNSGVPASGIDVLLENPNGSITTITTDDNGSATGNVLAGASVTAVFANDGPWLQTVLDTQPGDLVTFNLLQTGYSSSGGGGNVAFSVTTPAPTVSGATGETFDMGRCGSYGFSGQAPNPAQISAYCTHGNLTVERYGNQNNLLEYILDPDQSFSAGEQLNLPGPWIIPPTSEIAFTGIPSPARSAATFVAAVNLVGAGYSALPSSNSVSVEVGSSMQVVTSADASQATGSVAIPNDTDSVLLQTDWTEDALGYQVILQTSAQLPTTVSVGDLLVPWVNDYGTYDADSRTISWPQSGDGHVDYVLTNLFFTSATTTGRWDIIAPSGTSFQLPHLTDAYFGLEPQSAQNTDQSVQTSLIGLVPSPGYAAIRVSPDFTEGPGYGDPWFTGTLVSSTPN